MTVPDLRLGLVRQRVVDQRQKPMVLPEAEAEGDPEGEQRDDDPGPQLVEVADQAQVVVVVHRPQLRAGWDSHDPDGGELATRPAASRSGSGLTVASLTAAVTLLRVLIALAADRLLESAQTGAERAAHLRQPLGAEDQQQDDEEKDEVDGVIESDHGYLRWIA